MEKRRDSIFEKGKKGDKRVIGKKNKSVEIEKRTQEKKSLNNLIRGGEEI